MPQTDSSSRPRRRLIGLTIAAIGTLALIGTGAEMARRVSAHHAASEREQYVFNPVVERGFTYAGREVTIEDLKAPERVRITYGAEQIDIIPTMESLSPDLPGIARHEPWMRILRFAPRRGLSLDELERRIEAGEIEDRLVIVLRQPPAGAQPGTVEQAARSLWTFTFHELLPEGGFRTQRLRYPESERAFMRRQREAGAEGRDIERRADELREGSWEYYAALLVMPPLAAPAPTFVGDAVGSMGWTLPATSLLILLVMGSLAFALAPSREDVERRTA